MSKDIHKWTDGRYTLMFDEHTFFVWDNEKDERMTALNVTKKLNEQQATNDYLEESNSRLQIQLGETLRLVDEQQATINRMKHSLNTIYKSFEKKFGYDMRNAIWLIDEISYEEWEDKLHIAETDAMNHKESSMYWKNKCDEQQATIRKLQDLCGESDSENAKLRIENKMLEKEVNLLRPTNIEQYEQIQKLQEENEQLQAQLREKEEDEQLYANEIVKLNKEAKEVLDFKSLGGDY